ncbi:VOC family protein [Streptomyces sp. AJS327]|uniref:VOC family protein n=1 Tax=Streptomyces sp. AJS327 TaxID=2545265 RepID=UPI0015E04D26|nr:VOC family protein [Streptomyces sp. AJS327]MBA0049441.1 VOC family protein [Streptomyces sp. AJS327]
MTANPPNVTGAGLILASSKPEKLSTWYRELLEPLGAVWEEHMLALGGNIYLGFDQRDDVAERPAEPGRYLFNVTVSDMAEAERQLNAMNVRWIRPVEDFDAGKIATVEDPDGNYLQFLQINEPG